MTAAKFQNDKKVHASFFISGSNVTKVLCPSNKSFDQIAGFVEVFVVVKGGLAISAGWNHGLGAVFCDHHVEKPVGIVTLVGNQDVKFEALNQSVGSRNIGHLSFTQNESHRVSTVT